MAPNSNPMIERCLVKVERGGGSTQRPTVSSASPTSCRTSGSFPKLLNYLIHNHFQSRDFFIKTLDDSASGIQAIMARLADRSVPESHNFLPNPSFLYVINNLLMINPPGLGRWTRSQLTFSMNRCAEHISYHISCFQAFLVKTYVFRESRCSILHFAGSPFSSPRFLSLF